MPNTANLGLPLLQPAQAQKHVTVNEAIARLDGICQLNLQSLTQTVPPADAAEGAVWAVPAGATDAWAAQVGKIALFANGGWVFLQPGAGWRAHIADTGRTALFDGVTWHEHAVAVSSGGAASMIEVIEFDHVLVPGATSQTAVSIPGHAILLGITARVIAPIVGTLSSWRLGVADGADRYASGAGLSQGAWVMGLSGQPISYYADTPLLLSADGGEFESGTIRFALHVYRMSLPRA